MVWVQVEPLRLNWKPASAMMIVATASFIRNILRRPRHSYIGNQGWSYHCSITAPRVISDQRSCVAGSYGARVELSFLSLQSKNCEHIKQSEFIRIMNRLLVVSLLLSATVSVLASSRRRSTIRYQEGTPTTTKIISYLLA